MYTSQGVYCDYLLRYIDVVIPNIFAKTVIRYRKNPYVIRRLVVIRDRVVWSQAPPPFPSLRERFSHVSTLHFFYLPSHRRRPLSSLACCLWFVYMYIYSMHSSFQISVASRVLTYSEVVFPFGQENRNLQVWYFLKTWKFEIWKFEFLKT